MSGNKRQVPTESIAKIKFEVRRSAFFQIRISKSELPLFHKTFGANAKALGGIALRISIGKTRRVTELAKRGGHGHRGRCLTASPLLVYERNDVGSRKSHCEP